MTFSRVISCHICNTKRKINNGYGKYCLNCAKMVKTQQQKKKKYERIKTCRYCEKEFIAISTGNISPLYCSSSCRTRYWNIPNQIRETEKRIIKSKDKLKWLKSKMGIRNEK